MKTQISKGLSLSLDEKRGSRQRERLRTLAQERRRFG
jgi:hypothetical protein